MASKNRYQVKKRGKPLPLVVMEHATDQTEGLDRFVGRGGYDALKKALAMSTDELIEEVKTSGLRGRGGAGFPAGLKWSFVPKEPSQKYVVANADEGEPGTFKDRDIMDLIPHQLLEGIAIASYAIGADRAYVYIRGEYRRSFRILGEAIAEAEKKGCLGQNIFGSGFGLKVQLYQGAGAYICGEETALLESLEGRRGQPRLRPPYPAVSGLYGRPTVVNNVETLASVPSIIQKGGKWYSGMGTEKSKGTRLFSLSGPVKNPGNYEFPIGAFTFREFINTVGEGMKKGREMLGVIPGGISAPILIGDELDVSMDMESVAEAGSMLGSGAVTVVAKDVDLTGYIKRAVQFFAFESCGKCTPCREGCTWMSRELSRMERTGTTRNDLDNVARLAELIRGKCFCPLGESASDIARAWIRKLGDAMVA